jgi:hypothetical protein
MKKKWFGVGTIAIFATMLGSSSASASPLLWTLQGVTFGDGGTASGSFVYDSTTNTYSSINISVIATATYPAATFLFLAPGFLPFDTASNFYTVDSNAAILSGAHLLAVNFVNPLTSAGGTDAILLPNGGIKSACLTADCSSYLPQLAADFVNHGSVVASSTPEPATLLLISFGLFAIAARRFLAPWRGC